MSKLIRFGVSLDDELLERFDRLCHRRGYAARSEAIRDLIRASLVEDEWEEGGGVVAGTLTLVYDHHTGHLAQRLTSVQHDFHEFIIASLHAHLDHDNCLETILLKGPARALRRMAESMIAIKGVKHGELSLATTGKNLS